jgi:alkaline phosphatase D
MPLRASSRPRGADIQLYRSFNWGDLAQFQVLDTRQYRSDQPCEDGLKPRCAAALADSQTMTGPEQERWLLEGLHRSRAKWNVIAQQTQFSQIDFNPVPGPGANEIFIMDQWDGYVAARNRILSFLAQRRPSNPVIITGDIHSSWVHDIKADFANPASATLATEFVGTSITSDFPVALIPAVQAALPANPHVKFFDGLFRGYVRCELTRGQWRSDYRAVSSIATPDAPATTLTSWVVRDGVPGAVPAP